MRAVTCRDEVLAAARELAGASLDGRFTPDDVVRALKAVGSRYPAGTIRTHVVSRMCANAPANHGTRYPDLIRDPDGRYRLSQPTTLSRAADPATDGRDRHETAPEPVPEEIEPAGSSRVQREAETVILALLSQSVGTALASSRLHLPGGEYVDVDGFSADPPMLVEVWAHQGRPKVAQKHKVLADALKLIHVGEQLDGDYRRVLCFSDVDAAAPFFTARTWYAAALRAHRIEVAVVELPMEWRARIRAAQDRQFR